MSQVRWRQISSANLGFALPEKILIPPVVLIRSLPISDCQLSALPISNCRLPIYLSLRHAVSKIGNRQLAIGNNLAGAGGFEPTNAGSKDRCLTTWLRPSICFSVCSFKRRKKREPRWFHCFEILGA